MFKNTSDEIPKKAPSFVEISGVTSISSLIRLYMSSTGIPEPSDTAVASSPIGFMNSSSRNSLKGGIGILLGLSKINTSSLSMVVSYFNVIETVFPNDETNSVPFVYSYGILSFPVSM